VAPPSKHYSGNRYHSDSEQDTEIAEMPDWLIKELATARVGKKSPAKGPTTPRGTDKGKDGKLVPEGGRNDYLFRFACSFVDSGLNDDTFARLVMAENEATCSPPLDQAEVETIINSALGYRKEKEADYGDTPENKMKPRIFSSPSECISFFDAYYFKCIVGGKVSVLSRSGGLGESLLRPAFCEAHANKDLIIGEDKRDASTYWFDHTDQNFEKLVFDPNPNYRPKTNEINIWQGFPFEPEENGKAASYITLIKDVICDGKEGTSDFVLDVMACIVQKPHSKAGANTSIALRGTQGIGKSFFVENFGKLFGDAYIMVDDVKQITGRFNSFLLNKILVFGDEAIWGGGRANNNILKKRLISSSSINIEPKFKDSFMASNYCRFFFATNSDWVAPVERGNRRFLVLDVNETHKKDKPYFARIKKDLDEGGYADLLSFLQKRDVSGRDFENDLPKTEAMTENQLNGLEPVEQWLYEELTNPSPEVFLMDASTGITTSYFHNKFVEWAGVNGVYKVPLAPFTYKARKALPSIELRRVQVEGIRQNTFVRPGIGILQADFFKYLGINEEDKGQE
jgi:hypothetical protein